MPEYNFNVKEGRLADWMQCALPLGWRKVADDGGELWYGHINLLEEGLGRGTLHFPTQWVAHLIIA